VGVADQKSVDSLLKVKFFLSGEVAENLSLFSTDESFAKKNLRQDRPGATGAKLVDL
jgi:hypothetical protein